MSQRAPQTQIPIQGILRCRDLATLYYGFPTVASARSLFYGLLAAGTYTILPADPSRIGYEIVGANFSGGATRFFVGSPGEMDANAAMVYLVNSHESLIIQRTFLTDLDSITQEVQLRTDGSAIDFSVRVITLSPLPNDELSAALAAL